MDIYEKIDFNKDEERSVFWHSSAHVLAYAVKRLFPNVKLSIGPALDNSFFYEFYGLDAKKENIKKIEKEVRKIINEAKNFKKEKISYEKAKKLFKNEEFKLRILEKIKNEEISIYYIGNEFYDLCKGPHIKNTAMIKAFKIINTSSSYWDNKEGNEVMTRIYAVSFPKEDMLKDYLRKIEEAKKRDHRTLGKKLDLFILSSMVGSGLPLWTEKGTIIRKEVLNFSNEIQKELQYKEVTTPQLTKKELFETSGHYQKYKNDMFKVKSNYSNDEFFLKPMNCPMHTQLYASKRRSYKELPIKYADFSMLYRDEKPGELSGLTRVRSFSQDDGHCFCTEEQLKDEFKKVLDAIRKVLVTYGFDNYTIRLSLRDESDNYIGSKELWGFAENTLRNILKEENLNFIEKKGEAAFYGPKMDIIVKDSLDRKWQISTIQLDFNLPERFNLSYIDKNDKEKRPIMIHRALIGSAERFIALLIEHFAGKFPLWLNPRQIKIIPVANKFFDYCLKIEKELKEIGIRAEADLREITMAKKIREAEKSYYNYIIIIGEKEISKNTFNVRIRDSKKIIDIPKEEFYKKVKKEYKERKQKSVLA